MEVSGVRSSWETLAMKSRRVFSTRSVSVRSRSTATAPPSGRGAAVTSKARPGTIGCGARGLDLFRRGGGFDGGEEIGIADGFNDRSIEASVLRDEAVHGLVGPLHEAVGTDGDDGVLHAVEQGFELALAGAHGGKTAFDLAGGFVDGGGDAADFVEGRVVDAGAQVALLDAGGDIDDAFEAARGPDGGSAGDEQAR